jgi:hypothetical protein
MAARAGVVGERARRFWQVFELLTRESLDYAGPQPGRRFSGICRDGAPWQFCAVMDGRQQQPVRFLTEVGAPRAPLTARTAQTLARLAEVFELLGAADPLAAVRVLADLCPPDDDHIAGLWTGFAMGATLEPRLRLYANNGWGEPTERWLRLILALRRLDAGHFGARLQPLLETLVPVFSPSGLALTLPASSAFCKLYLRPTASPWASVRVLARALLGDRAKSYIETLEAALERRLETLPSRAVIVSMAGSAARDGALDLKLDLCGHCLFRGGAQPGPVIDRLARFLKLDTAPYQAAVEDFGAGGGSLMEDNVAFLGVGANALGESRINVYLTAPATRGRDLAEAS